MLEIIRENIIGLTILAANILYTTLRPVYLKWRKDRKINFHKHLVFGQFKRAQDEIDQLYYLAKNPVRYQNIKLFIEESNKYLMDFCTYAIQKQHLSLSDDDFEHAMREALYDQLNKFKRFTENAFEPIVRLKFGEYLHENQEIMAQYIETYAAEKNLTHKQKVWFMLNVVRNYLKRIKHKVLILNRLNGDLDAYEQKLLEKI